MSLGAMGKNELRAQRVSARQAARAKKAAAAAAAAAARGGVKRKAEAPPLTLGRGDGGGMDDDDFSDSDDEGLDGAVPIASDPDAKPCDIAKTKYNHIEDEKERKRLKRLLRNRVSAQQARERKKAYLGTLEQQMKAVETKLADAEDRIKVLERENQTLRQVLKSTTGKPM